ncbi:MAG: phage tail sheath family protein [Alkaliphilus sp.]
MALGGGTFLTQNKILPGSYINFISAARAQATMSDRGIVAFPFELDFGVDGAVFTVTSGDFQKDSMKIFGYGFTDDKLKNLREVFKNAKMVHCYRLNSGLKATAAVTGGITVTAKHSGIRGNDLRVVITQSIDNPSLFEVTTMIDNAEIETQLAATIEQLVSNDFVDFTGTGNLVANAGLILAGGTNKAVVEGADYQTFLSKIEPLNYNILGCPTSDITTIGLFVAFTKRMRDEVGAKFQTVVYRNSADHEGVISLENTVLDAGTYAASLVAWVSGASAKAPINGSLTNVVYDGEYEVDVNFTQSELKAGILAGKFLLHKVGDDVRILDDINTFTSFTPEKSEDFASNQVIRVLDHIANDIGSMFASKYLGKIQNNDSGRVAFWNDLVTYNKQLEIIQAIEDFKADDVVVEKGTDKKSVVVNNPVTPVSAMSKLYMTVIVH